MRRRTAAIRKSRASDSFFIGVCLKKLPAVSEKRTLCVNSSPEFSGGIAAYSPSQTENRTNFTLFFCDE